MGVVCVLQPLPYRVVLICSLLSCQDCLVVFEIQKVFGHLDGSQTMSDHQDRKRSLLFALNLVDRLFHLQFTLRVQSRRSFIENQYLRFLDQGAGNSNSLFLPATQVLHATSAHVRIKSFFALLWVEDEPSIGLVKGTDHVLLGGQVISVLEVVSDGSEDEDGFLGDVSDRFA